MTRSIEEILAVAEDPSYVRVATAKISMVPQSLRDEHADLVAQFETSVTQYDSLDGDTERRELADRIGELEAEMDAATIEFRFRSIGRRAWTDLLAKHPPSREQLAQDKRLDHNPVSFPPVAIAASCIDPVMSLDDVKRLERAPTIDVAGWNELWSACLRANVVDAVPKSRAAGLMRRLSVESEKQHTTIESLDLSSLAE